MSREMTVFLPGPATFLSGNIVHRVGHSWAGTANSGGVPTFVTSIGLLMREFYAATGKAASRGPPGTSSLTCRCLEKSRIKSHEKS